MSTFSLRSLFPATPYQKDEDNYVRRLQNVRVDKMRGVVIDGDSAVKMVWAAKKIGEKLQISMEKYITIPPKYHMFLAKVRELQERLRAGDKDAEKQIKLLFQFRVDEIINFDDAVGKKTIKELLRLIHPFMIRTRFFVGYLRMTANALACSIDIDVSISLLMVLLFVPLVDFFKFTEPDNYRQIWGYCGTAPLPDDLNQFQVDIRNHQPGDLHELPPIASFTTPIKIETQVLMALLMEPQRPIQKSEILSRIKTMARMTREPSKPLTLAAETVLNQFYKYPGDPKKYRLNIDDLPNVRQQLADEHERCMRDIETCPYLGDNRPIVENYVEELFKQSFRDLVKLEIGMRLLKSMFPAREMNIVPASDSPLYAQPSPDNFVFPPLSPPPQDEDPPFLLVPTDPCSPIYKLVPIGPAPIGYETDPAWNQNASSINGPITYQNEEFRMYRIAD